MVAGPYLWATGRGGSGFRLGSRGCRRVAYRVSLVHGISSGRRSSLDFAPIPDVGFIGGLAPRAAADEEGEDSRAETEERQEEKQ